MELFEELQELINSYSADLKQINKAEFTTKAISILTPFIMTPLDRIIDEDDLFADLFKVEEHFRYPDSPIFPADIIDEVFENGYQKLKNLIVRLKSVKTKQLS